MLQNILHIKDTELTLFYCNGFADHRQKRFVANRVPNFLNDTECNGMQEHVYVCQDLVREHHRV